MLNKQQHKEFKDYCQLNEIEDIDNFIVKCAKDGLTLDKYGVAPFLTKITNTRSTSRKRNR